MSDGKYRMPPKTVKLQFPEDSEYAGAWVRVIKKPTVDMAIITEGVGSFAEQVMFFAEHIGRGWNIQEPVLDPDTGDEVVDEETGETVYQDVPYNPDAFLQQPYDFVTQVFLMWAQVAGLRAAKDAELDPNSSPPSSDGAPSAEASTPTLELLYESPSN